MLRINACERGNVSGRVGEGVEVCVAVMWDARVEMGVCEVLILSVCIRVWGGRFAGWSWLE